MAGPRRVNRPAELELRRRRITKAIQVGDVQVGGDAPVSVQSMTKTDTRDVAATVAQIEVVTRRADGTPEVIEVLAPAFP